MSGDRSVLTVTADGSASGKCCVPTVIANGSALGGLLDADSLS